MCPPPSSQSWELMLVLEDDALVVEDFQRQLSAVLCDLPDSWDVLYLNAHHKV